MAPKMMVNSSLKVFSSLSNISPERRYDAIPNALNIRHKKVPIVLLDDLACLFNNGRIVRVRVISLRSKSITGLFDCRSVDGRVACSFISSTSPI